MCCLAGIPCHHTDLHESTTVWAYYCNCIWDEELLNPPQQVSVPLRTHSQGFESLVLSFDDGTHLFESKLTRVFNLGKHQIHMLTPNLLLH